MITTPAAHPWNATVRTTMSGETILIIEDETALAEILTYNLEQEGFRVVHAADGQEGLQRARRELPDLVILDLMLPVVDGLAVCRSLRADSRTEGTRILMLTARAEETDEIVGFNMGADDYVTKPFKVKPLVHRVKALLRRPSVAGPNDDVIVIEGIEIDRIDHIVRIDDRELHLTPTEFLLLWTFARQPGRTFSRTDLMSSSRGDDANAMERTIDVHIRALREKLGRRSAFIETVRGVGYRFRPRDDSD